MPKLKSNGPSGSPCRTPRADLTTATSPLAVVTYRSLAAAGLYAHDTNGDRLGSRSRTALMNAGRSMELNALDMSRDANDTRERTDRRKWIMGSTPPCDPRPN